jgi:penicillin-binding protein 1C
LFPSTLIKDVPTKIAEYQPENFDRKYDGVVTAKSALYRSLNVPSVRLLQDYGLEKFHSRLKYLGFKSINKGPDHYGLTLVLGGAECSLWELCNAYYQLAKKANNEEIINLKTISSQEQNSIKYPFLSAESAFITAEMITETKRPLEQGAWKIFSSARKVAWKTGTSFGHRDAWSIGTTPEYIVGVWVGNADGEGRPGLTGVKKAAPVMFDVFRLLPETSWFKTPAKLVPIKTCKKSGFLPTNSCKETVTIMAPAMGIHQKSCPFHKIIQLDSTQKFRINSNCYPLHKSIEKSWFTLPALEEWYYKRGHPDYKVLPPFFNGCEESNEKIIDFIYPKGNTSVLIPKDLEGKKGRAVFHAVHKNETATLYWFLDDIFVGTTNRNHKIEISPKYGGKRKIIVVDNNGYRVEKSIFFIEK